MTREQLEKGKTIDYTIKDIELFHKVIEANVNSLVLSEPYQNVSSLYGGFFKDFLSSLRKKTEEIIEQKEAELLQL